MSRVPRKNISKKTAKLRDQLWPDLSPDELWQRSQYDGFTSIPRTMSIIMGIIDNLVPNSKRASFVYLSLWLYAYDEMYVSLSNDKDLAFHSGYTGQRAVRSWRERIKELEELGFIRTAEGSSGRYSHAVIINPHFVIRRLAKNKTPGLTEAAVNALIARAIAINALDMTTALPEDGANTVVQ